MLVAMGSPAEPESYESRTLTVGEWLDAWLASTKNTVGPQTQQRYEQVVRLDLKPALGTVRIRNLKLAHVEDLRDAMLETAATATLKYVLGVLSPARCLATRTPR